MIRFLSQIAGAVAWLTRRETLPPDPPAGPRPPAGQLSTFGLLLAPDELPDPTAGALARAEIRPFRSLLSTLLERETLPASGAEASAAPPPSLGGLLVARERLPRVPGAAPARPGDGGEGRKSLLSYLLEPESLPPARLVGSPLPATQPEPE